jgi:hypothetical protein
MSHKTESTPTLHLTSDKTESESDARLLRTIEEKIDRLLGLARQSIETDLAGTTIDESIQTEAVRFRLAADYESTAGALRRRAERPDRSAEQRAQELQRAEWYQLRAIAFRTGKPLPPNLRTPRESCAIVDDLRKACCAVAGLLTKVTIAEVAAFQHYLVDDQGQAVASTFELELPMKPDFVRLSAELGRWLNALGVRPPAGSDGDGFDVWTYDVPLSV